MDLKRLVSYCCLFLLLTVGLALPAADAQEDEVYTYTVVGGSDESITYPDQVVNGFVFSNLSFRSHYPDGMEFRATIIPPDGVEIDRVSLPAVFTLTGESANPARVRAGDESNEWIATLYELRGMAPWHELDAR